MSFFTQDIYLYQDRYIFVHNNPMRYVSFSYLDGTDDPEPEKHSLKADLDEWPRPEDFAFSIPKHIPWEIRAQAEAILQAEDRTLAFIDVYEANALYVPPTLNDEQTAFMRRHHSEITRSYGMVYDLLSMENVLSQTTERIASSLEYKATFGEMSWDDAHHRFFDSDDYDVFLKAVISVAMAKSQGAPDAGIERSFRGALGRYQQIQEFVSQNTELFESVCQAAPRILASLPDSQDYDPAIEAIYLELDRRIEAYQTAKK